VARGTVRVLQSHVDPSALVCATIPLGQQSVPCIGVQRFYRCGEYLTLHKWRDQEVIHCDVGHFSTRHVLLGTEFEEGEICENISPVDVNTAEIVHLRLFRGRLRICGECVSFTPAMLVAHYLTLALLVVKRLCSGECGSAQALSAKLVALRESAVTREVPLAFLERPLLAEMQAI